MKPPEMWSRKHGHCDRCNEETVSIVFIELAFPKGLQVRLCRKCRMESLAVDEEEQKPHKKPSPPSLPYTDTESLS